MENQHTYMDNNCIQLNTTIALIDDVYDNLNHLMALFEVLQLDEFVTLSENSRKKLTDLMGDLAHNLNDNITRILDSTKKAA